VLSSVNDVTQILDALGRGEKQAAEKLLPVVYHQLRQLAGQKLSREAPGQTLQATALVHEAWLRLVGNEDPGWENRAHFFGAAAEAMRRILVEKARRRDRLKHGGEWERIDLDGVELPDKISSDDLLALNDALHELEEIKPEDAEVVKLRFFAGLSNEEVAAALNRSLWSVKNSWAFSRVWLYRRMRG
jgi:RNA polymerase sigma factor (TIGR02999 family)